MKKNIGRISFFVILINAIFLSIYLVGRNRADIFYDAQSKKQTVEMTIYKTESVSDQQVRILEEIITDKGLSADELVTIRRYSWFLTDSLDDTENYKIEDAMITIFVADGKITERTDAVLSAVLKE